LQAARRTLAKYNDMEELIRIGAYRPGTDAQTDAAMRFFEPAEKFLGQRKHEGLPSDQSFAEIYQLLGQANVEVVLPPNPPPAAPQG
ncbi:hypothetical protein LCGC14_1529120, partial [marine sediment metagenome]